MKSGAGPNVFSHFNRVKMSDTTLFDLYFETSNGDPFTLLGMWEELLILAGP